MKVSDVKIRFNIKSCMLYEKIRGKSFFRIETEEDVAYFLYSMMTVCNPDYPMTFKVFTEMMGNKKFAQSLITQYQEESDIIQQFMGKKKQENSESEDITMTQLATSLIILYGVDAHYVMYEMGLWEIMDLFEMAEQKKKGEMEENRLWTYLTVAPSIDTKKIKSPEKFLPFPWEKEEDKQKKLKDLEKETERAKSILGRKIE